MEAVRLRPTRHADLAFVLAAEEDSDTRPFILPWTRQQHSAALTDPDLAHRTIEVAQSGTPVGFMILAGLECPHQSIELRRIVVTMKGRGFGRAAVRAAKRLAFEEIGAHRLWLDVKEHNQRARKLYETEGFLVEGVLRECLRGERGFESLVVMSLLASEYH